MNFDDIVHYIATTKKVSFKDVWKMSKEVSEQRKQKRIVPQQVPIEQNKGDCTSCNGEE